MSPVDSAASPRPLRVALIGCGKMGVQHLKAIAATGKAVVVGIADPAASAEELRALLPADAIVTGSAETLFERAAPEVVHIVTPPSTHADLAMRAIEAGCHIYVEKPFAPTKEEARRVLAFAAERGLRACAGHQVLFEAPALAVKSALPSIGRVVHVESYFAFRMVRRNITRVEQAKDILPHAVYPVVEQLRAALAEDADPIELAGLSVDASGEIYAILRRGKTTAVIIVTLNGRPVEQYEQIVGTNGSLRVESSSGAVIRLVGPGAGVGALFTPYRRASQTATGALRGLVRRVRHRHSYPGLAELLSRFYESIRSNTPPPLTAQSILDTVDICERIGDALDAAERAEEESARQRLLAAETKLPAFEAGSGAVLVTGGTGLLGRRVAEELRTAGFPVRVVARRLPPFSVRVPGVEYAAADLASGLDASTMRGIDVVVHCAAETAGGQRAHQRNSVDATRLLVEAAAGANVRRLVHVSSLAVLKTSREEGKAVDESTPIDPRSSARGPYVWGKAESEILARRRGAELGLQVKVIRPGPLVDYANFQPPGRLGREVGPVYVAIGPRRGSLSVCDVSTAARVVRSYVEHFDHAPELLNLVDAPPPSRRELVDRVLSGRPDLRVMWVPAFLLRSVSGVLKLVQRFALGAKQPIDVAAAFASERYRTELAARTIEFAGGPAIPGQARG